MVDFDLKFWAGTDESFASYLATMRTILLGKDLLQPEAVYRDEDEEAKKSRLVTMAGDIAVIKIAGKLVNSDHWTNRYYGLTGYPEIREALVQVATDPQVLGVILDVNSGGGSVSGVFDTAKLITQVDKIKPVHTFSDGMIASAAYLLGSSARTVTIGRMTEAGSVGVLLVHQEVSKLMKEIGITPTVMRAGKFKALGNPFEPLSKAAEEELQGQLDYMYQIFVEHVADRRKVSYEVADNKMAQGRIFIGDRAEDVGLVDAVATFDQVASKLQGGIDAKKRNSQSASNFTQGKLVAEKKPLTEQEVAALALGAGTGAAGAETPTAKTEDEQGEGLGATAEDDKTKAGEGAAPEAKKPADEKTESEMVAFLKTELAARDEKILSMTVELRDVKVAGDALKESHKGLRAIAETSVGYLRVALGVPGGAKVEDMTDAALLAEQSALAESFEKKFKAGGVASVSTEQTPEKKGQEAPSSVRQARLAATRTQ